MQILAQFVRSGINNPCPVCGRTKDQDCRSIHSGDIVLCHSYRTNDILVEESTGYKFSKETDKGPGAGVWYRPQPKKLYQQDRGQRETYYYGDRNGQEFIRVVKYWPNGAEEKQFYQEYKINGEWLTTSQASQKGYSGKVLEMKKDIPIYRYTEIREAISNGQPIVWAEGEKVCDALWSIGQPATTSIGGCQGISSWGNYDNDLDGLHSLLIAPDMDKPGAKYAQAVRDKYQGKVTTIKHIKAYPRMPQWNDLPEKSGLDLADEIQEGLTAEDLLERVGASLANGLGFPMEEKPVDRSSYSNTKKEEKPEEKYKSFKQEIAEALKIKSLAQRNFTLQNLLSKYRTTKQVLDLCKMEVFAENDVSRKRSYTFDEFCEQVKDDEEWVLPGILPRGDLSIFIGNSGSGKSLHSYEAAYQTMIGGIFCGGHVQKGKVLFIQTDEGHYSTKHRMVGRGFSLEKENFRIMPRFNFTQLDSLEQELIDFAPDLIVIDTLRDALQKTGIDENTPEAGQPLNDLKDLLKQYNSSAILIHYVNKKTDAKGLMRCAGNIAIPAKAYSVFEYSQPTANNQQEFKMHSIKDRDGSGVTYWHNLDTSNGNWSIEFKTEEGSEAGEAGFCDRIIQLFKINYEKGNALDIQGGEICSFLGITPDMRKGAYMALKRLHQRGVLIRTQTNDMGSRPIYKYKMSDRHLVVCGLIPTIGVTDSKSLDEKGFDAGNTPSNRSVTDELSGNTVTQSTMSQAVESSKNDLSNSQENLVTQGAVTMGVTSPVTTLESSAVNHLSDSGVGVTQNPPAHTEAVTKIEEPKKDAHPFGKPGYIDRSQYDYFLDNQGKPIFVGSKVIWQDPSPEYKGMTEFVVERIYKDTVQLSLVKYLIPYGQLEAKKDITNGFRIGDLIQPNWKALKEAKYPVKEMQEAAAKELPLKGQFVTVTNFYSTKVQSVLFEGLEGLDETGYKYSINPKYWEKVNVDGDE
ncbi:MAG: AAA family ATPase [Microcoleus sp.]